MTFADQVIMYHDTLDFTGSLPDQISIMNPYKSSLQIREIARAFYDKFYGDDQKRHLILGINPGRLGAGSTGIPFTDTKRLASVCGIPWEDSDTHEPSSVFVYRLIEAFGGPEAFYSRFYINSVCPLGFTITNAAGKEINYNYYDRPDLQAAVYPFIVENIRRLLDMPCRNDKVFCLGTGKNFKFLKKLNDEYGFFGKVIPLEHPRYVMQYKAKEADRYIDDFVKLLG
ncbi:MAG: DUF4918 family protein [Saprospiraceae bacterium]|nr:DUF4918 family protein [Saprospiraceae bacterium]